MTYKSLAFHSEAPCFILLGLALRGILQDMRADMISQMSVWTRKLEGLVWEYNKGLTKYRMNIMHFDNSRHDF